MDNNTSNVSSNQGVMGTVGQLLGRFIVAAIILGITAFFTPNFSISNIWALALAAIVLTVMDYLMFEQHIDVKLFSESLMNIVYN